MSGILDKKSRIIDFIITENGRSQIEDGDIRYKFATFSDKSIIYTKNHEISSNNKSEISNSEFDYIPLEVTTKNESTLNPEFDLGKFFSYTRSNILDSNEVKNSINFNNSVDSFLSNDSLSNKLNNLKLITTKSKLNHNSEITFKNNGYDSNTFDFEKKANKYKTIDSYKQDVRNMPVLALDKRFSNKLNYKILIPKDISGDNLYDRNHFKNINLLNDFNTSGFVYSSYSSKSSSQNTSVQSRKKEILEIIRTIEADTGIHKKVYEIENNSEDNTFIFEMHEAKIEENTLEKLAFVKLGSFFDNESSSLKTVYLIGKIVNSREDSKDLDTLFDFNNGKINLKNKSNFAISAFYSFVTMFTLIVE
jgi:hypothetical protein